MNSISTIAKQSLNLFSENFKLFITFSLILGLISFFGQVLSNASQVIENDLIRVLVLILYIAYAIFISTFYGARLGITLMMVTQKMIKNQDVNIKKEFKESKVLFWPYFINALGLGLIIVVPIILNALLYEFIGPTPVIITIGIISLIFILYIFVNFGFSITISVLRTNDGEFFNKSKAISTSNIAFTIPFYLIMGLYMFSNILLSLYFQGNSVFKNIIPVEAIIGLLTSLLLLPLFSIFSMYAYNHLNDTYIQNNSNEQTESLSEEFSEK